MPWHAHPEDPYRLSGSIYSYTSIESGAARLFHLRGVHAISRPAPVYDRAHRGPHRPSERSQGMGRALCPSCLDGGAQGVGP
jgi:hypothetical protein